MRKQVGVVAGQKSRCIIGNESHSVFNKLGDRVGVLSEEPLALVKAQSRSAGNFLHVAVHRIYDRCRRWPVLYCCFKEGAHMDA